MAYVRTSRGAVTRIGNPYSRGSSNYNSRQAYINANRVSAPSSGSSSGGGSTTTREAVYRSVPVYRTVFDQAGYDKYVKEETGRAIKDVSSKVSEESSARDKEVSVQRKQAGARQQFVKPIEVKSKAPRVVAVQQKRKEQAGIRETSATVRAEARLSSFKKARETKLQADVKASQPGFTRRERAGSRSVLAGYTVTTTYTPASTPSLPTIMTDSGAITTIGNPYTPGSSNYNAREAYISSHQISTASNSSISNSTSSLFPNDRLTGSSISSSSSTKPSMLERATGVKTTSMLYTPAKNIQAQQQSSKIDSAKVAENVLMGLIQSDKTKFSTGNLPQVNMDTKNVIVSQPEQNLFLSAMGSSTGKEESDNLLKLYFKARQESGGVVESRATDSGIVAGKNPLVARQEYYTEEKSAADAKVVDAFNVKREYYDSNYSAFQSEFKLKDLDPSTPELELSSNDYGDYQRRAFSFEQDARALSNEADRVNALFKARNDFQEAYAVASPSGKTQFGFVQEFDYMNYQSSPAELALQGTSRDLLSGILALPETYAQGDVLSSVDSSKELVAPTSYTEELEFKKQFGLRAAKQRAEDPYEWEDLKADWIDISHQTVIGAGLGATIGTVVPGAGTVAGGITGMFSGFAGGVAGAATKNIVYQQTGSELISTSTGFVANIGGSFVGAGLGAKAVKVLSVPKLVSKTTVFGKETTIVSESGDDFVISGGGATTAKFRSTLDKFRFKPATIKSTVFSYKENVDELFKTLKAPYKIKAIANFGDDAVVGYRAGQSLGLKTMTKAQAKYVGVTQDYSVLLPDEELVRLTSLKFDMASSLKGETVFESRGLIRFYDVGKGYTGTGVVKRTFGVMGAKNTIVRPSPTGTAVTKVKIKTGLSTLDDTIYGSRVDSQLALVDDGVMGTYTKTIGGTKIEGQLFTGKTYNVFGKKPAVVYQGKPGLISDLIKLNKEVADDIIIPISSSGPTQLITKTDTSAKLATKAASAVKITKPYLDVYGLQSAMTPAKLNTQALLFAVGGSQVGYDYASSVRSLEDAKSSSGYKPATASSSKIRGVSAVKLKEGLATKVDTKVLTKTTVKLDTGVRILEDTSSAIKVGELTSVKVGEGLKTQTLQVTGLKTITTPTVIPTVVPDIPFPIITPPIILPIGSDSMRKIVKPKGSKQGYDSFVRESKFGVMQETQVANDQPFKTATKKAMKAADGFTQRTVIIKKGGYTKKKDIKNIGSITKKFNKPASKSKLNKLGKLTLVEKSRYAIDSRGEKMGIPYRAAKLKRSKYRLKL